MVKQYQKKYWITLIGNFQYERKRITIFFCWFELQSKHIIIIDTCLSLVENCYSKNNNEHITSFFQFYIMLVSLQEKMFFETWLMTRLLVMEDIYDYMTM
jgi:hypothetical protein